jgi:DNA-directed RNA polymerase specialized sigma24 family protein
MQANIQTNAPDIKPALPREKEYARADIYSAYRPFLLDRFVAAGLAHDEAEEVIQETWVEILLQPAGGFTVSSIDEIASRNVLKYAATETLLRFASGDIDERLLRISNAVARLAGMEQAVVLLTCFAGMDSNEVAKQLDIQEVEVNSLLSNAQRKVFNAAE